MRRIKKSAWIPGIFLLLGAILQALAWFAEGFADWFREKIFPITRLIMGKCSDMFSFSIGEILLGAGVALLLIAVIWGIFLLFWKIRAGKNKNPNYKIHGSAAWFRRYLLMLWWIFCIEYMILNCNCFVLYHCKGFTETYFGWQENQRQYTIQELVEVRQLILERANQLAQTMERNEKGDLLYQGDIETRAKQEMLRLGKHYPLLDGYYTDPKEFGLSGFFSQQYMMGYYYPFSMEANYNGRMYVANLPPTICHEYAHIRGFMYEEEANFIGYLACETSEDPFFEYCGYLSVIDYLNHTLWESLGGSREAYLQYDSPSELVLRDSVFLTKEEWEEVEENALLDTEFLHQASQNFLNANLNLNGIEEGTASYSRVVDLLIRYYE